MCLAVCSYTPHWHDAECIYYAHSFHMLVQAAVTCPQAEYYNLDSPIEAVNVVLVRAIISISTFTVCYEAAFK